MKNINKKTLVTILPPAIIYLVLGITLLCLGMFKESLFAFFPIPFMVAGFYSFFYPKDINQKKAIFIMATILRIIFVLCGMLIPTIIWANAKIYSDLSFAWVILPYVSSIMVYALVSAYMIFEGE